MKDKTKHTPGPWQTAKDSDGNIFITGQRVEPQPKQGGNFCQAVAVVKPAFDNPEANADLIAQAPNLLKENQKLKELNHSLTESIKYWQRKADTAYDHGRSAGHVDSRNRPGFGEMGG